MVAIQNNSQLHIKILEFFLLSPQEIEHVQLPVELKRKKVLIKKSAYQQKCNECNIQMDLLKTSRREVLQNYCGYN